MLCRIQLLKDGRSDASAVFRYVLKYHVLTVC